MQEYKSLTYSFILNLNCLKENWSKGKKKKNNSEHSFHVIELSNSYLIVITMNSTNSI